MIHYYKSSICKLKADVNLLQKNTDDMLLLLRIQKKILHHIKNAESKIKKINISIVEEKVNKRNRNKTTDKNSLNLLLKRKDFYRNLIVLWKSFGDALLFVYISKFNAKRLLYDSNFHLLPDSGFILGKKGSRLEYNIAKGLLRNNFPVVLCDITNVIRHGDICFLGSNDPFPFEVKSSSNSNKRVKRQKEKLKELLRLFHTDTIIVDEVAVGRRVEVSDSIDNEHHMLAMNNIIQKSLEGNSYYEEVESGLYYIAVSNYCYFENVINSIGIWKGKRVMPQLINSSDRIFDWKHFYPFILSIVDPDALYRFVSQSFMFVIILDIDYFCEFWATNGYLCEFPSNDELDEGIIIVHRETGIRITITTNGFLRLFYEFTSLRSLLIQNETCIEAMQNSKHGHDTISLF